MNPAARRLAYLGLGSNLGDRAAQLAGARTALCTRGVEILRQSSVVETEPWGVADQPRFLNQVIEVSFAGSPAELLATCKDVETDLGRVPRERWREREIDVDILVIPGVTISTPELVLPHPRIKERDFVLAGLDQLGVPPDILAK